MEETAVNKLNEEEIEVIREERQIFKKEELISAKERLLNKIAEIDAKLEKFK
jgi:hypothetical protein